MTQSKTAWTNKEKENEFFSEKYEKNDRGFYVRVAKPSGGKMNEEKFESNLRSLLEKAASHE